MESMTELFQRGGALMWVLLGFSVVAVAVIMERGLVYLRYGLRCDGWMARLMEELRAGRLDRAAGMAKSCRHPVARVVEEYLGNLKRPAKIRRDNVARRGTLVLEDVEKRLRVLAAIAHLAPLVGLLGTVMGMVVAFAQIQSLQGAAKPADLAGGIWEALLTTVFGLVVAIPSMAAFHGYESHADKIARRMEMAVTELDDHFDSPGDELKLTGAGMGDGGWSSVG
ncbi:MAG: MotA/TolQ/ExbB proton channel family protein [Terrimicrobiaceae bacterium]